MNVTFSAFGGITPRLSDHMLGYAAASKAHDVKLRNGILEPWLTNCHFADAVKGARSFHIYGCCPITWDSLVTAADLPPDWRRFYIAGRNGNGLEAVELKCECEPVYYTGGVPTPTQPPVATVVEECSREADARSYVYTYVNKWGEESAPSPASNIVRVNDGTTVLVSGIANPPEGYGITHVILYRSATGFREANGREQKFLSAYLFLDMLEVPLESDTYEDKTLGLYLGAALETQDDRPPPFLSGVVSIRDQIRLAGWHKNRVYLSANLMPHNWPASNDLTLDHTIIHMAELDQRLFVTTDSHPYIIDVSKCDDTKCTPVVSVETALPDIGCKKANGAVITPHGLFYASPIGIILLMANGDWHVVTAKWFGEEEWRKLMPDTITMAYYEGYLFFSTDMATFLLDINGKPYDNNTAGELVTLSDKPIACMTTNTNALVFLQDDELLVWSGGNTPREYVWCSRPLTGGTGGCGRNVVDAQMAVTRLAETYSGRSNTWSPASVKMKGAGRVILTTPRLHPVFDRFIGTERPVRVRRHGRHLYYWLELRSTQPIEFLNIGTAHCTVNGGK